MNETIILVNEVVKATTFNPEWITAISTSVLAILTLATIWIALFWESKKCYRNRPIIDLIARADSPCVVYDEKNKDIKYFRIKVKNLGKTTAKGCRLRLIVAYPDKDSNPAISEPVILKWSSSPLDSRFLIPENLRRPCHALHPRFKEQRDVTPNGGWELCDFFRVAKGGKTINFISSQYENKHLFKGEKDYNFSIEVFGDNFKPKVFGFKINNSSDWEKIKFEKLK